MTRNLKALGLVLAAVFALSAVAASAAMAQETNPAHFFSHAENGKTHIHGQQLGEENVFTFTIEKGETKSALTFECPGEGTTLTGTIDESTATKVIAHPAYAYEEKVCRLKIGETNVGKAKIDTEGCDYILSANTDVNGHAQVRIECEEGKEIKITAPLGCVMHIPPQIPEGGVHYTEFSGSTESGEETILLDATLINIQATATGCPNIPENIDADYEAIFIVEGYEDLADDEGSTTGLQVSLTWTETEE